MSGVVGVIGHVDHGKTALVRALTGMETDRLEEEKRRGISIALGFAHLQAGDGSIDLIDMPGHERFVRTMVSGATGIDAVLMVVAANEGIKPQTIEHLDIASLLGLKRVLIAVSKVDLVDAASAEAAAQAAAALVGKAGMQVCGTVLTSATTGQGLDALRTALAALPPSRAAAAEDGFPYLPIDRVFSVPGHGTVVTGTLRRGRLAVSDEVACVPGDRPIRLRGLQIHGSRASAALPGQRVAVNLRDVPPDTIGRGVALTARGLLPESTWLTVTLRAVASAPALRTAERLVLLYGTAEIEVRLRLLDCDELGPGGTALAQLRSAAPLAVPARERFILRRVSPPQTLAGGRVIDPAAARLRRHAPGVLARLHALADADPAGVVAAEIAASGPAGIPLLRLAQLAGVTEARAAELLRPLSSVLSRSRVALQRTEWDRVLEALHAALASEPAEAPPERVAALLPWAGRAVLDDAVTELVQTGKLVRAGGGVRLPTPQRDRERADAEAAGAATLAATLRRAGLSPPDVAVVAPDRTARRLVDRLIREGVAIRAVDKVQKRELVFHQEAVEQAKTRLRPLLSAGAGLSVGEAGAALGISRKYCVPLLEHLDSIRFTRRIADRRVLAVPDV